MNCTHEQPPLSTRNSKDLHNEIIDSCAGPANSASHTTFFEACNTALSVFPKNTSGTFKTFLIVTTVIGTFGRFALANISTQNAPDTKWTTTQTLLLRATHNGDGLRNLETHQSRIRTVIWATPTISTKVPHKFAPTLPACTVLTWPSSGHEPVRAVCSKPHHRI